MSDLPPTPLLPPWAGAVTSLWLAPEPPLAWNGWFYRRLGQSGWHECIAKTMVAFHYDLVIWRMQQLVLERNLLLLTCLCGFRRWEVAGGGGVGVRVSGWGWRVTCGLPGNVQVSLNLIYWDFMKSFFFLSHLSSFLTHQVKDWWKWGFSVSSLDPDYWKTLLLSQHMFQRVLSGIFL